MYKVNETLCSLFFIWNNNLYFISSFPHSSIELSCYVDIRCTFHKYGIVHFFGMRSPVYMLDELLTFLFCLLNCLLEQTHNLELYCFLFKQYLDVKLWFKFCKNWLQLVRKQTACIMPRSNSRPLCCCDACLLL